MRKLISVLPLLILAGCASTGVTEADQAAIQKEFSKDNYEKAMKDAGKGAELEEEKRKEAEYLKGGQATEQN